MIPLNNELTRLGLEGEAEEARILLELTDEVRAGLPALLRLVDGLGGFDLVFRPRRRALAEEQGAVEPLVTPDGDLEPPAGGAAPLLLAQRRTGRVGGAVVPIDLRLPAARPALVMSGPNTGGKTVALETVGLLVLTPWPRRGATCRPRRKPAAGVRSGARGDRRTARAWPRTSRPLVLRPARARDPGRGRAAPVLLDELGRVGTDPAEGRPSGPRSSRPLSTGARGSSRTTHLEPLRSSPRSSRGSRTRRSPSTPSGSSRRSRLESGIRGRASALTMARSAWPSPASVDRPARAHLGEAGRRLETLLAALESPHPRGGGARGAGRHARGGGPRRPRGGRQIAARTQAEAGRRRAEAETEGRARSGGRPPRGRARAGRPEDRRDAAAPGGPGRVPPPADRRGRARPGGHERARCATDTNHRRGASSTAPASGAGSSRRPTACGTSVQAGRLTVRVARREVMPAGPVSPSRPGVASAVERPARGRSAPRECHLLGDHGRGGAAGGREVPGRRPPGRASRGTAGRHGKGTGALRRAMESDPRARPMVSAFRHAEPAAGARRHGGEVPGDRHRRPRPGATGTRPGPPEGDSLKVPPEASDEIRGRVDLVDLVRGGRAAEASRGALEGLCPSSPGADPVFTVHPGRLFPLLGCQSAATPSSSSAATIASTSRRPCGSWPTGPASRLPTRDGPREPGRAGRAPRPHGMGVPALRALAVGARGRRARATLPGRARHRAGDGRHLPARLRAGGLGPPARRRARGGGTRRRRCSRRARDPAPERQRPLRPLPRPPHLPDRGHAGARHRVRRPGAGRRGAEVPEFAGDAALPEGADPLRPAPGPRGDDTRAPRGAGRGLRRLPDGPQHGLREAVAVWGRRSPRRSSGSCAATPTRRSSSSMPIAPARKRRGGPRI